MRDKKMFTVVICYDKLEDVQKFNVANTRLLLTANFIAVGGVKPQSSRRDSNSHALRRRILSALCIAIPPRDVRSVFFIFERRHKLSEEVFRPLPGSQTYVCSLRIALHFRRIRLFSLRSNPSILIM